MLKKLLLIFFVFALYYQPAISQEFFKNSQKKSIHKEQINLPSNFNNKKNHANKNNFLKIRYDLLNMPFVAYIKFSSDIKKLTHAIEFIPSIKESYFPTSDFYDTFSVSLFKMSVDNINYQIESLSSLYKKDAISLISVNEDDIMHSYLTSSYHIEPTYTNISFGIGFSMFISSEILIQTLFSTGPIPNHGKNPFAIRLQYFF